MLGKDKWHTWKKLEGMTQDETKRKYIDLLLVIYNFISFIQQKTEAEF